MTWKRLFRRFLDSDPRRRHFAAHSHHPWPDVTHDAHQQAWTDAAELHDAKWDKIFGEVLPEAQSHVARLLGLADGQSIAFAPNTHELVLRLLMSLPQPVRILTTDAEFHSFARQSARLQEAQVAQVQRIAAEPFGSFTDRFVQAASDQTFDIVFLSHVFFDSGMVVDDVASVVGAVASRETLIVIDGYHHFMARPFDLAAYADRVFYLAGGYKYAMAGEGAAFMHCPPGYIPRPIPTGWFASFNALEERTNRVGYPLDGRRFLGSTFDPTGIYRFNAVQRLLLDEAIDVRGVREHVEVLQHQFLAGLEDDNLASLARTRLLSTPNAPNIGSFITFRTPAAGALAQELRAARVVVDRRSDRLRIGFGIYQDEGDVDDLLLRLSGCVAAGADRPVPHIQTS